MDVALPLLAAKADNAALAAGAGLLRQSLDGEQRQASQLLQTLPTPGPSLEAHLGVRFDSYA